jgi:hypothetical protein
VAFPFGKTTYEMIFAGDTPETLVGGYGAPRGGPGRIAMDRQRLGR